MRKSERGAILPMVALCLGVLMGFGGMAVDVGYLEYQQRQQQNAADAAALAGAQQLIYSGCPNPNAAQTAGRTDSGYNGFVHAGTVSVTIDNPPATGPFSSNNCAVKATVNNTAAKTFFTRFFGWVNGMPETTDSTAAAVANGNGCVYLLDPAGTPTFHGAKISAPGCSLLMNGSPDFNGGDIDFSNIGYAGSVTEHGTRFDEASPMPMPLIADPCAEITGCHYLAQNAPTASGCRALVASSPTISPGCYSSISGNGTLNLLPGLYILTGTNNLNGATLTGNGVTLYITSTGSGIDFHGTKVNLAACTISCTGGAVANVLYYQVPGNSSPVDISGPSGSYSGLIYAPNANATVNGNAGSGYSVLVFADWTLNGTGQGMTYASPPPNASLIKTAVLMQ